MDGIPKEIISHKDINISPGKIETLVAIISPDGIADVYVNETKQKALVVTKALKVEKDQLVCKDDISGVSKVYFDGITFPSDHSYLCVLSLGWDKIYIFDYFPIFPDSMQKIEYDVEKYIGSIFSYHLFKEYHQITNQEWEILFKQKWFLFYALKADTIDRMIKTIRSNWQVDDLIEIIEKETIDFLDSRMDVWAKKEEFVPVIEFISLGIKHHKNKDYISSSMIVYPKIESLIRKDFINCNPDKHGQNQKLLSKHINQKLKKHYDSLTIYLPDRFQRFLDEIYFASYKPDTLENEVNRNSTAHGASSNENFTRKSSLLGLLIFSQITQLILLPEKRNK